MWTGTCPGDRSCKQGRKGEWRGGGREKRRQKGKGKIDMDGQRSKLHDNDKGIFFQKFMFMCFFGCLFFLLSFLFLRDFGPVPPRAPL